MTLLHEGPPRPDVDVLKDVIDRLEHDSRCRDARVGVAVADDVVSLTGEVATVALKREIEHAVHRVAGVRAVVSELVAVRPEAHVRDDGDLARAAANVLRAQPNLASAEVEVTVSHGIVTLDGCVDWPFQRTQVVAAVADLPGVVRVEDRIHLTERVRAFDVRRAIAAALQRRASRVARGIRVELADNRVTLTGCVATGEEKDDIERASWGVEGVLDVRNRVEVRG